MTGKLAISIAIGGSQALTHIEVSPLWVMGLMTYDP